MPVDENRWPGPSWDFTEHTGGFPPMNVPGDLYTNTFGIHYLNTGKRFEQLTDKEYEELLEEARHEPYLVAGKMKSFTYTTPSSSPPPGYDAWETYLRRTDADRPRWKF
jgi:hypothetical protein